MVRNTFYKIISVALIFSFVFSSTFFIQPPKKAEAFAALTFDGGNFIQNTLSAIADTASSIAEYAIQYKEFVLDGIVNYIAKAVLRQLTTSVVNWINSGFDGNPSFVTDPAGFFANIANEEIGKFIEGSSDLNFLCSPFRIDVRIALAFQYSPFKKRITCTFTDSVINLSNAVGGATINGKSFTKGNFSNGGWDNWISLTTNPQNNVYGATLMAQVELSRRIADRQKNSQKELDHGRGFLSWKSDCTGKSSANAAEYRTQLAEVGDKNSDNYDAEEATRYKNMLRAEENTGCKVNTPGSVIEGQLGKVLGSSIDSLGLADEFNEIVNALFAQLVNQVVGGGGGLRGASQPTYDGSSYLDKLGAAQDADTLKNISSRGADGIDKSLELMDRYKAEKQASFTVVLIAENKLVQLEMCYTRKVSTPQTPPLSTYQVDEANRLASEARASIETNIASIKNQLSNDITAANTIINKLEVLKSRIANTTSLDDTLKATSEYEALLTSKGPDAINDEIDVSVATVQKEDISAKMKVLNTETDRKIGICESGQIDVGNTGQQGDRT